MQIFAKKSIHRFSSSIILEYQDLKDGKNLESMIETAFGPKGTLAKIVRSWDFIRQ